MDTIVFATLAAAVPSKMLSSIEISSWVLYIVSIIFGLSLGRTILAPGKIPRLKITPMEMAPKVGSVPEPDEKVYLQAALDSCKHDFRTLTGILNRETEKHKRELRECFVQSGAELAIATTRLQQVKEAHKEQLKSLRDDFRLSGAIFDMEVNLKNAAIEDLRLYKESVQERLRAAKIMRDRYIDLSRRADDEIQRRVAEALLRNHGVRLEPVVTPRPTGAADRAEIAHLQGRIRELEGSVRTLQGLSTTAATDRAEIERLEKLVQDLEERLMACLDTRATADAIMLTADADRAEIERLQGLTRDLRERPRDCLSLGAGYTPAEAVRLTADAGRAPPADQSAAQPEAPTAQPSESLPTPPLQTLSLAASDPTDQGEASSTASSDSTALEQPQRPTPTHPIFTAQPLAFSTTTHQDSAEGGQLQNVTTVGPVNTAQRVASATALPCSPGEEQPPTPVSAVPGTIEPPEVPVVRTPEHIYPPQPLLTVPAAPGYINPPATLPQTTFQTLQPQIPIYAGSRSTEQQDQEIDGAVGDDSLRGTNHSQSAAQPEQEVVDDRMNVGQDNQETDSDEMEVSNSSPPAASDTPRPSLNFGSLLSFGQPQQGFETRSANGPQTVTQTEQATAPDLNDQEMGGHPIAPDHEDMEMGELTNDFGINYFDEPLWDEDVFAEIVRQGFESLDIQYGQQPIPTASNGTFVGTNAASQQGLNSAAGLVNNAPGGLSSGIQTPLDLPTVSPTPAAQSTLPVRDRGTKRPREGAHGAQDVVVEEEVTRQEEAQRGIPATFGEIEFDENATCVFCGRPMLSHDPSCATITVPLASTVTDDDALCVGCDQPLSGPHATNCMFLDTSINSLPPIAPTAGAAPRTGGDEVEEEEFERFRCDRCHGTINNHLPYCPALGVPETGSREWRSECHNCHQPNPEDPASHEAWCTWLMALTPPETSPIDYSSGTEEAQMVLEETEEVPEYRRGRPVEQPELSGECPTCRQPNPGNNRSLGLGYWHDNWCYYLESPPDVETYTQEDPTCFWCGGLNWSHLVNCNYDLPPREYFEEPVGDALRSEDGADGDRDSSSPDQHTEGVSDEGNDRDRDRSSSPRICSEGEVPEVPGFRPFPENADDEELGEPPLPIFGENATDEEREFEQRLANMNLTYVNNPALVPANLCAECLRPEIQHRFSPCRAVCWLCKGYYSLHTYDGTGCVGDGGDANPEGEEGPQSLGPVAEEDCSDFNCMARKGWTHKTDCPISKEAIRAARLGAEQRRVEGRRRIMDEVESSRVERERVAAEDEAGAERLRRMTPAERAARRRGAQEK